MIQLLSHWTDFHEIWYLGIFRKSIEKIQISLQSDKNIGYFIWRPVYIYDNISLNSSYNEKYFGQICREIQDKPRVINSGFPQIMPFMR